MMITSLRPQQFQMMDAIRQTLDTGGILCVESGTGTGKTLAYLLPVLRQLARGEKSRIAIATSTRTLQEQIVQRELPLARRVLARGLDGPPVSPDLPLPALVLKGRDNYLCLARFERLMDGAMWLPEMPPPGWWEAVRDWRHRTATGDQSELDAVLHAPRLWSQMNARRENCAGRDCPHHADCFLMETRRRAEHAGLLILNHHLLLAELAVRQRGGAGWLPPLDALVLDEAHDLEAIASQQLGRRLTSFITEEVLRESFASGLSLSIWPPGWQAALTALQRHLSLFWEALGRGLVGGDKPRQGALPDSGLEEFAGSLGLPPESRPFGLAAQMQRLGQVMEHELERESAGLPDGVRGQLRQLARRWEEIAGDLLFFGEPPAPDYAAMWEIRAGTRPSHERLHLAALPLSVAGAVGSWLENEIPAVILTSATLTCRGSFSFFRSRLGLAAASELRIDSPFDYARQSVLYIPRDLPAPNTPDFLPAAAARMRELVLMTGGRTLVLCTSLSAMRFFHNRLRAELPYPCFIQDETGNWQVVERFRQTPGAVLFACLGLWQGIDIPGPQLSSVIMDRLPFARPDEPLHQARVREMERQQHPAFAGYTLPRMLLTLRQGFGRLIRSPEDRGFVTLLDIRGWRYWSALRESLPSGLPFEGDLEALRRRTADWFGVSSIPRSPAVGLPAEDRGIRRAAP